MIKLRLDSRIVERAGQRSSDHVTRLEDSKLKDASGEYVGIPEF
jgi:hypothetical protein